MSATLLSVENASCGVKVVKENFEGEITRILGTNPSGKSVYAEVKWKGVDNPGIYRLSAHNKNKIYVQ